MLYVYLLILKLVAKITLKTLSLIDVAAIVPVLFLHSDSSQSIVVILPSFDLSSPDYFATYLPSQVISG